MPAASRLLLLLLVLGGVTLPGSFAFAQAPGDEMGPVWTEPLRTQDLARFKHALLQSDPRQLVRAKLDMARAETEPRFQEFLSGRGTLDILLEAAQHWLDSELALCERDTDRVAALARHWQLIWTVETVNRVRYDAARIPLQDLARTQYARLEAEVNLVQTAARAGPEDRAALFSPHATLDAVDAVVRAAQPVAPGRFPQARRPLGEDPAVNPKGLAQAKPRLVRADPAALARAKVDAARTECDARFQEFLSGRGTLDILQGAARRRLDAERALSGEEAAAVERYWELTRVIETVNHGRMEAGRIPVKEWQESRATRIGAELLWLNVLARQSRPGIPVGGMFGLPVTDGPLEAKELARAKFAAMHADPQNLAAARVTALAGAYESREKECLAGRCSLDRVIAVSRDLLLAELAILTDSTERRAAHERRWLRMKRLEEFEQVRYDAGRIPIQDLLASRYARLEAESWLVQAAGKPER
jgi:hypothetical protein